MGWKAVGWSAWRRKNPVKNLLCPLNKKDTKSFSASEAQNKLLNDTFGCFLPMQLAFLEGLLGSVLWIFKKHWVQLFPQKSRKNRGLERNHLVCGWRWQQRPRSYVVISAIELGRDATVPWTRPRFMGPERRSFTLFSRAEWEGENTNRSLPIKWSNARELWNLHFFACTCKGNHIVKAGILLGTLLEIKTTSEWVIPIATDTVDKILFGWRLRCQKNVLVWLNWGLSHPNLQKKITWQNLKNESHVYVSKFQGRFKWISY